MAFDSTISGNSTTSYIPVATADAYFALHLDGPAYWSSATLAVKQAALSQASNRIDAENYSGRPTVDGQRLQWPRSFVVARNYSTGVVLDTTGRYYLDNNTIPKELSDAVCEQALYYIKQNAGEFTVDDNDLETLSTYKIGPIDVSIKSGLKADRLPTKVKTLLASIGVAAWLGSQPLTYVR